MLTHATGLFWEGYISTTFRGWCPLKFLHTQQPQNCIVWTWGPERLQFGLCPIFLVRLPGTAVQKGLMFLSWCFFNFFSHRISELRRPIAVKLCHTISMWLSFIMQVRKLGGLQSPQHIVLVYAIDPTCDVIVISKDGQNCDFSLLCFLRL